MSDVRRRLFVDIETSPLQVFCWDLNSKANQYISHDSIIVDRGIICICWKWAGSKKVGSLTWDNKQCDKKMLKEFVKIWAQATEVIGQNIDRFDAPWILGRCLIHGIAVPPRAPTIDTLKKVRQKFRLPSNRLDYLGKTLVGEQKLATGFGLWRDIVLYKCDTSMRKMVRYCKQDVRLLEKVYERIQPYIESTTSVADYPGDCPECGARCSRHQRRKRASGVVQITLLCKNGHSHSVSETKLDKNKRFAAG